MEKLMLIDGHSIMNRAFYGVPILTNKKGQHTNAIYGFLNILFKLMEEENPEYIGVSFDLSRPTFRHLEYSEYKGNRKKAPEEFKEQIPYIKDILNAMGIAIYEKAGFEADDILATIAVRAEEMGISPTIVSGDRDLLQVATDNIKIKLPKTKGGKTEVEEYFAKDVLEEYGVSPTEFIDVKALMGDASDNIPGVQSIGEKTAIKIIKEYKTVENAIENAENIKPKKAGENLIAYKELALLSKRLVTIDKNVDIEFKLEKIENIFNEKFLEECKKYELKTIISKFNIKKEEEKIDFNLIEDSSLAREYLKNLPDEEIAYKLMFDDKKMVGISFSHSKDFGTYIKLEEKEILDIFKSFFEGEHKKITMDAKTDIVYLNKHGIELKNLIFDIMIGSYILNPTKNKYQYNHIAEEFLEKDYIDKDELLGKLKSKKFIYDIEQEKWLLFCARHSYVAYMSYPIMKAKIEENNQQELFYDIEMPLIDVLASMETLGIKVCKDELLEYQKELSENIETLTGEIYELAGEEFNINSPKQLGDILFEKLGLKGGKKTTKGYSTSADILEKLKDENPIVDKVLTYRTYSKLKSTYADGLLSVLDEKTSRVHSNFNQTATATGRISSTEPNLQNIPIKIELGHRLRKVFIPEEDYIFVDADYSQIELRVLAYLSQDKVLIDAFNNGEDIHKTTASNIFKKPIDEITSSERSVAKAINFGLIYGKQAFSLANELCISKKQAENYIEEYFLKYPSIKAFLDNIVRYTKETGYTKTVFNRLRNVPEINASNFMLRGNGERIAMNTPIQGTAADIIKIAMVKVYRRIKKENLKSRLILQVHDELLIETYKDEKEKIEQILKDEMENAVSFSVKMLIDINEGETWYDTK